MLKHKKGFLPLFIIAATLFTFIFGIIQEKTALGATYQVKNGDTLYYIAKNYGVSIQSIKTANKLKSSYIVPGQVLYIPAGNNSSLPLRDILRAKGITNPQAAITIVVDKSKHALSLYGNGKYLKSYHVELGNNGLGDKISAGDHKTPEGIFYIAEKSVLNPADPYLGSRWMRLSYPNIEDAQRGLAKGLIDYATYKQISYAINHRLIPPQRTALGGGVGIHGGSIPAFGRDWTWGCVGLKNADVEEFYNYVTVGTKVTILP